MSKSVSVYTFWDEVESLFDELITQQQNKVLATARNHLPHLTHDDVLNPHDFPELLSDPVFNYEEGMSAGILASRTALRAHLSRTVDEKGRY